ncbi:hypothetical protein EFE22_02155 [Lactobacillus delbrueckii subsp. lactis]|uniref:HdeD family acid-resistance protein n=1 Tax=Lactobacillus delbrueckii TaxID=1584 RepID=UPI001E2BCE83|nr:DUF308 domain-containing protein [Lactobacillus delbrueckii]MCD5530769.1 DUF308 domain-containing protein [Lactobacillus delbrueckii subsp. lactis]MCS8614683.1 hypothetical protein [Lactobacillus delbrueckii subsp. lactis]
MFDSGYNEKRGFDWGVFIAGVISVVLSIFLFANPGKGLRGLVIVLAVLLIMQGSAWISMYAGFHGIFGPSWTTLLSGIFDILIGIFFLWDNRVGAYTIAILVAIWFIVDSVIGIVFAWHLRFFETGWYFFFNLLLNILGLVVGVMLLLRPVIAVLSTVYLIAIYLMIFGINEIALAFMHR